MTLGNMRQLGAQRLVAYCLNDACRHQGLIDVSKYPDDQSAVIRPQGGVRQVRVARAAYRRAAELERAGAWRELTGKRWR